jgi:hypothetical protein
VVGFGLVPGSVPAWVPVVALASSVGTLLVCPVMSCAIASRRTLGRTLAVFLFVSHYCYVAATTLDCLFLHHLLDFIESKFIFPVNRLFCDFVVIGYFLGGGVEVILHH